MDFPSPFVLPTATAYIGLVCDQLPPHEFHLPDWTQVQIVSSLCPVDATPNILWIAKKLLSHPRLLHGANSIIGPRYKVHCSTTTHKVEDFVLVNQETYHCEIYSHMNGTFTRSSNSLHLQQLIHKPEEWDKEIGASSDNSWLACVAQVLQEIIDNPHIEPSDRSITRRRLHRLGMSGILPPSVLVHFVDGSIPHYDSMREYSTSGGFCDAHKITVNNIPLCFRVLRQWENSDSDKTVFKQFCRELSVWHQLRHRNILPLIGATMEGFPGRYCFVVPWFANGSISSYLRTHPDHDKYMAISQIVDGLDYLHNLDPPVGHKDLKGDNVLVGPDLVCVITDFGLASLLETQRSTTQRRGTQCWMAPELSSEHVVPQDCRPRDVFSLGCTMFEILAGEIPRTIWLSAIKGEPLDLPPTRMLEWGREERRMWRLVEVCVKVLPETRPVISDIKRYIGAIRQIDFLIRGTDTSGDSVSFDENSSFILADQASDIKPRVLNNSDKGNTKSATRKSLRQQANKPDAVASESKKTIPKLKKGATSWKEAIKQWEDGTVGMDKALKDWPESWYVGHSQTATAMVRTQRKNIADEYNRIGRNEDEFLKQYPMATESISRLLKAIRKKNQNRRASKNGTPEQRDAAARDGSSTISDVGSPREV